MVPPAAIAAALVWLIFSAVAYSNAGTDVFETLFGLAAAGAWMMVWLVRLGLTLWRRRGEGWRLSRAGLIYWGFEPAALAVVSALSASGALAYGRFLVSERALTEYADAVRAGTIAPQDHQTPARRVGLYRVSATERLDDGAVRFITGSEALLDAAGFVHSPHGPPAHMGEDSYQPFRGAWYVWRQSW